MKEITFLMKLLQKPIEMSQKLKKKRKKKGRIKKKKTCCSYVGIHVRSLENLFQESLIMKVLL